MMPGWKTISVKHEVAHPIALYSGVKLIFVGEKIKIANETGWNKFLLILYDVEDKWESCFKCEFWSRDAKNFTLIFDISELINTFHFVAQLYPKSELRLGA